MPTRAAIYTRISSDTTGEGLGVARQEQDCLQLVTSNGWDLAAVYTDNDRSAYSGKPRPGYQALLRSLRDGDLDAVVAWHPDRLHRSPRELEAHVVAVVLAKTADLAWEPPDVDVDHLLAELANVEDRKDRLAADFYTTGVLSDQRQFRAASEALEARVGELRRQMAARTAGAAHSGLVGDLGTLGGRWPGLCTEDRVAVLRALNVRVVVNPEPRPGHNRFNPARVAITVGGNG